MSALRTGPSTNGAPDPVVAVPVAIGLIAVMLAAVWAGAQLAALAFGAHHPLATGAGDTVEAALRLVVAPGRPARAWPPPVGAALPGPAAYWGATAVPLALAAALGGIAAVRAGGGVGVARRRRMGLDPEAAFARPGDLTPLWVDGPVQGRVTIGVVRRWRRARLVATEDSTAGLDPCVPRRLRRRARRRRGPRGAILAVGPSQCGKTAALAIPAILEWDGPVVALSVKNDLMGATLARRRRVGQVQVFDPAAATAEPSTSWSPLRDATSLAGARRAARSLANSTAWTSGSSSDMGFWTAAAEDLLGMLFFTGGVLGVGMTDVVGWVTGMDKDTVRSLLTPLTSHHDPRIAADAQVVLAAFTGVWAGDKRQISSTYLVARQMVGPWQEPVVAASSVRPRVDLNWLLDRGPAGTDTNTLYLCADLDEADRLAPVLGGLVDDLMHQAYDRAGRTDTPLNPALLVVIDEAGNWPMRNLPGRISTCAGLGIQLLLVFQSKAQIDAAYGPKADIVVSNAITKLFFAGLSDKSSLDYAAGLLGQEHTTQHSTSTDQPGLLGGTGGGRSNHTAAPTSVELMPAPLLRQVAPGQALLVHNTLAPAHLHGRYWYLEPDLYALATGDHRDRRHLATQARHSRIRATPVPEPTRPGQSPNRATGVGSPLDGRQP